MRITLKKYRRTQRWFRENPEKRRLYNRRYYLKNAEARREDARARRRANPQATIESNRKFRELNPGYRGEKHRRDKLKRAWIKWSRTCAASRISHAHP